MLNDNLIDSNAKFVIASVEIRRLLNILQQFYSEIKIL